MKKEHKTNKITTSGWLTPKHIRYVFIITILVALPVIIFSNSVFNAHKPNKLLLKDKVRTVVIDPGHGGKDPGCNGSFVNEKNVALGIGLKLGKLIEEHFPDVKVVFTRKTDVFIELYQRAEIANKANADLFICIHCNSGGAEAHGSETYALGLHRAESNLAVAKRENSAILLEDNYNANYDGFDVNSPEGSIIFSLYQNTFLNRSLSFAAKCQKYFRENAGRTDRGVKQAGFLVLVKTAMPSVLIETGFLTNKSEEKFLMEPSNQMTMATCIFKAFTDYKNEVEGANHKPNLKIETQQPEPQAQHTISKPISADTLSKPDNKLETNTKEIDINEVCFRVQIKSSEKPISLKSPEFKGLEELWQYDANGSYKYTYGKTKDWEEAKKILSHAKKVGFADAFIVAFKGTDRIPTKEALEILAKIQ